MIDALVMIVYASQVFHESPHSTGHMANLGIVATPPGQPGRPKVLEYEMGLLARSHAPRVAPKGSLLRAAGVIDQGKVARDDA